MVFIINVLLSSPAIRGVLSDTYEASSNLEGLDSSDIVVFVCLFPAFPVGVVLVWIPRIQWVPPYSKISPADFNSFAVIHWNNRTVLYLCV